MHIPEFIVEAVQPDELQRKILSLPVAEPDHCISVPDDLPGRLPVVFSKVKVSRRRTVHGSHFSMGTARLELTRRESGSGRECGADHHRYDAASDCVSALSAIRCGKRCTSCGQPTATAIRPAQYLAACSAATSAAVKPLRCSLDWTYGPSVKMGVPLRRSTRPGRRR